MRPKYVYVTSVTRIDTTRLDVRPYVGEETVSNKTRRSGIEMGRNVVNQFDFRSNLTYVMIG